MSRIAIPTDVESAPEAARSHLEGVRRLLGATPNMFRLTAQSPAAIEAMAGFFAALNKSTLSAALREQIALTVANVNGCAYCSSAHTYLGRELAKLAEADLAAAREGRSNDAKTNAALVFARKVAVSRANVSVADLDEVRDAGFSDAELIDIVASVALNVFTNYINEVFQTDIDFPRVDARRVA